MNQIQEDKFLKPYRNMQFISDMDPDSFIRKIKGEVRRRQTVHRRAMTSGIAVASIVLLFFVFQGASLLDRGQSPQLYSPDFTSAVDLLDISSTVEDPTMIDSVAGDFLEEESTLLFFAIWDENEYADPVDLLSDLQESQLDKVMEELEKMNILETYSGNQSSIRGVTG